MYYDNFIGQEKREREQGNMRKRQKIWMYWMRMGQVTGGWYEAGSKNTNFNHVETGKTRCESLEVGHDLD